MEDLVRELVDAVRAKRVPDPSWAMYLSSSPTWEHKIQFILQNTPYAPQSIEDLYALWSEKDPEAKSFLLAIRTTRVDTIARIAKKVAFERFWTDGFRMWRFSESLPPDVLSPYIISRCSIYGALSTEWTEIHLDARSTIDLGQRTPICASEIRAAEKFAGLLSDRDQCDAIRALNLPVPPFRRLVDWR